MANVAKIEKKSPRFEELEDQALLGDKEAAFALAFFAGPTRGNKTRSYLAIQPTVTLGSAGKLGHEMMQKEVVRSYLRDLAHASGLTRELIEEQIAYLAGSDISELKDVTGLSDLASRPRAVRHSVKKMKTTRVFRGSGDAAQMTETVEIEMHGKEGALSLGADVLGMRKNQENRGLTVIFALGAGLGIDDDPPIDVTP